MISYIFFYLFVSVLANDKSNEIKSRIFYGESVKIEDYPFYAGLANCGAAILSDVWILTAAHCVVRVPRLANYVWVGGESYANSKKVTYNQVIVHHKYKYDNIIPLHDVALIKLSEPLELSEKVKPIKLPSTQSTGTKIALVGRGVDETNHISENLKKLDLVRLSPEQCLTYIPFDPILYNIVKQNLKFFGKAIICAKREEDLPSICQGDSGSPLFSNDTLIGLASFGGPECAENRLGFYVNVQSYVPWIKQHTGL
ncbi:unnamed protein product, partial [Brenthis ino]